MRISVVTTLYQSAPYILEFHRRMTDTLRKHTDDFEGLYVNDGSPDQSLDIAVELSNVDESVSVIDLSRNFGHHKAAMTGLQHANGELVFLIDVDLEEEPEILSTFIEEMDREDADVTYGVQHSRKGSFLERFFGGLYYRMFNALSDVEIPCNLLMARLMSKRYVEALVEHKENLFDISGLWSLTGFKQVPVTVEKLSKLETTYTFGKRTGLFIDGLVSFSNKPLIMIAVIGLSILMGAIFSITYYLVAYFYVGDVPDGFTTLALSIWFLGGLTIFLLGVIALYLSVIFIEVKNRPYSIIRKIYNGKSKQL